MFFVAALVVLSGCSRQRNRGPAKTSGRAASGPAVSVTPVVTPAPLSVPPLSPPSDRPATAESKRPSPFADPGTSIERELTKVTPTSPVASPGTASRYGTVEKLGEPIAQAGSVATVDRRRPAATEIPSPPVLPPPARPESTVVLDKGLCCVARATYEPVRPHGLRRMIGKVPGLRRLQSEDDDSFSPPHPVRDITFVLPPGGNPVILQKKHIQLKANVDESGAVTRVELVTPKDDELLTMAADAASAWKFVPARLNDKTVPSQIIVHFYFDRE